MSSTQSTGKGTEKVYKSRVKTPASKATRRIIDVPGETEKGMPIAKVVIRGKKGQQGKKGTQTAILPVTLGSEMTVDEPPIVDIKSDAFRTIFVEEKDPEISNKNVIKKILGTDTFSKKEGTPQARITALVKACKKIILYYGNPNYDKQPRPEKVAGVSAIFTVNRDGEITGTLDPVLKIGKNEMKTLTITQFMELFGKEEKEDVEESTEGNVDSTATVEREETSEKGDTSGERGWWNKSTNKGVKQFLNDLVDVVINEILPKKIKNNRAEAELISSLWSIIMVKSLSDISQCGELVNNLTYIKDTIPPEIQQTGTIYDQINRQAKAAFVSSDKICAGVSSIILNKLRIPFETLCTRKSSRGAKTIQNVICQRVDISALAIIFTLFNKTNTEDIGPSYIFKTIGESDQIIDLVKRLFTEYLFYNNELSSRRTTFQREYDDLYAKRRADRNISIYFDPRFSRLSAFIFNIYSILADGDIPTQSLKTIGKKLMLDNGEFRCPLWTYYVSTDVFRLLYPDQNVNKDAISFGEISAATIDGTYGHDFHGIECIKKLGEKFMDLFGIGDYKINTESTTANDEKNAIIRTLQISDCITIDQQEDDLLYRFNNMDNFLVSETNNGFTRQWHFFDSLFSLQPLILSIDFTVGIQPYAGSFATEKGIAKDVKQSSLLIRPTDPQSLQIMISDEIKKTGSGRELVGVCALYDGAAPYNIFPYFITGSDGRFQSYITKAIFPINREQTQKITKRPRIDEELETIELSFTTSSKLTPTELEDKYKDALIPTKIIPIDGIFQKLKEKADMTAEQFSQIIDTLNDDKNQISNTFNDIWSLLLNFKEPKSKKTKIELNKADCESLLRGFNNYCGKFYPKSKSRSATAMVEDEQPINTDIKNFCDKIRDIFSGPKLTAEEFRDRFDDIMMDIMIYITNPENTDNSKQELLQMFNSGITNTISKNNEITKDQLIYGRRVAAQITKADGDKYKGLGLLMGLNRLDLDNRPPTGTTLTRIFNPESTQSKTQSGLTRSQTLAGLETSTARGPTIPLAQLNTQFRIRKQPDVGTDVASQILPTIPENEDLKEDDAQEESSSSKKRKFEQDDKQGDKNTEETEWETVNEGEEGLTGSMSENDDDNDVNPINPGVVASVQLDGSMSEDERATDTLVDDAMSEDERATDTLVDDAMSENDDQKEYREREKVGNTFGGKKHKYTKRTKKNVNKNTRRRK
jgi:hypothetical protein